MSEKILSEESLTEIYEKCDSYAKEVAVTGGTNNVRILIRNIRQLRTENAELRKENTELDILRDKWGNEKRMFEQQLADKEEVKKIIMEQCSVLATILDPLHPEAHRVGKIANVICFGPSGMPEIDLALFFEDDEDEQPDAGEKG